MTRQLVMSALARTELADGVSNDTDLVAEVFGMLGLTRLVVTPRAVTHFGAALRHHRQSRTRTSVAWTYIKQTVRYGDDLAQRATDQAPARLDAPGCSPTCPSLQPRAPQAAALCI